MTNFFDQFDSPQNFAGAISTVESGGNYGAMSPDNGRGRGRALGKYQVLESNIGPWSQEALGYSVTPQEFLRDPKIQDAVFQHKFGTYEKKYGPDGAARAWFAGEGGMNNMSAR